MPGLFGMNALVTFLLIVGVLIASGVKILREYDRAVIFRLGRMVPPRGPGLVVLVIEQAGSRKQGLGGHPEGVGNRLEHGGRGLVEAALDLAQVGIRDLGQIRELAK